MTTFKANRKFPNPITVTDDPRSHTLALQQVIEALNIGQRRTREVGSSYVRVQELVDVGLIEIVGNQLKLTNLGSTLVAGGATELADLTDVDLTGLADGDVLVWNSGTSKWEPGAGGGGGGSSDLYDQTLNNLADVSFYMPQDGDVLTYVADTGMWDARQPYAASGDLASEILALSPTAYWKLTENSGTFADSSGNGNTLTGSGTINYRYAALRPNDLSELFPRLASSARITMSGVPAGVTAPITGSWSVCAVAVPPSTGYVFGIGGLGETAATNFQLAMYTATGTIQSFWESGSGTDRDVFFLSAPLGAPCFLTMVKDASALTVSYYVNGLLAGTGGYTVEPTGGSSVETGVGAVAGSGSGAMSAGHVAFFNGTVLTAEQIMRLARAAGFARPI